MKQENLQMYETIMGLADRINYYDNNKPWELAKSETDRINFITFVQILFIILKYLRFS